MVGRGVRDLREVRQGGHADIWGTSVLGRRNRRCKGPKVGVCLAWSGNKDWCGWSEQTRGKWAGGEGRVEKEPGRPICRALWAKLSQGLRSDCEQQGRVQGGSERGNHV